MNSFVIREEITVKGDPYIVVMQVTAIQPLVERDMPWIKDECARLLPAWIRGKIDAGETK